MDVLELDVPVTSEYATSAPAVSKGVVAKDQMCPLISGVLGV
jgi:hypothetical protein